MSTDSAQSSVQGTGLRQSHFGSGYDAGKAHLQAEVEQLKEQIRDLQDQVAHLTGYADGLKRGSDLHEQRRGELEKQVAALTLPIRMILRCWACGNQHIDRDEWATRPHKTHLCEYCGAEWRPSNTATVGVARLDAADGPAQVKS